MTTKADQLVAALREGWQTTEDLHLKFFWGPHTIRGATILVCDAASKDSQKIVFWDADEQGSTYPWCVEDAGYYAYNAFTHWKALDAQPLNSPAGITETADK